MAEIEIVEAAIEKPEIEIDKAITHKLINKISEESQVIVHCSYTGEMFYDRIRIWKSTFLFPKDSIQKSKLVHHENITLYPVWTTVMPGQTIIFTLVFTALPKHCKQFDLIEKISEPGGFELRNIKRNNTDVYWIDLT